MAWTEEDLRAHQMRQLVAREKKTPPKPINAAPDEDEAESALHYKIMDYCRKRGWVYYHGSMAAKSRRTLGEIDLSIRADRGRVFDIECKRPGGKLRPTQLANKVQCEMLGHKVHVVHSFDEFLAVVGH